MSANPREDAQSGEPLDIWQQLSRIVLAMLALVGLLAAGLSFRPELDRQRELDRRLAELRAIEAEKIAERDELRQEYEWLTNEPEYLQAKARDVLDLKAPGEIIFRIERDEEQR